MHIKATVLAAVTIGALATQELAQDQHVVYVAQYSASVKIVQTCKGFTTYRPKDVGNIAKSRYGLRKQRVLKLVFYTKADRLDPWGDTALASRGVSTKNPKALCRFAKSIAGKDDPIGRFLRIK